MADLQTISLVILPPEREDALLALAEQWTKSWLLSPALWIRATDVKPDGAMNPHAPPVVEAIIIGRNGTTAVDLFSELGRREYELVRVVALRSVEVHESFNEIMDSALDTLREALNASRPGRTRIQFVNVICSPTYQAGASSARLIERGWSVNVVASPENRPTPNSFDGFTRHSDHPRWTGFMLAHLATAAGLWATLPESPYDDSEPAGLQDAIQLQRLSIRGVLTGGLVVSVALQAMSLAIRDETPLADALTAVDESDVHIMSQAEEAAAVEDLVRIVLDLDGRSLMYRAPTAPEPITQERIGFWSQLRQFSAFAWDKIRDIPSWFTRRTQARASRKATAVLHGDGGEAIVDIGSSMSREDAELVDELKSLDDLRQEILERLHDPVPALRYDVSAALWKSIRESTFALLDGSPLPEGSALTPLIQQGARASIVPAVSSLLPDWRQGWAPPSEIADDAKKSSRLAATEADWLDVAYTDEWAAELRSRAVRITAREATLRERLGAVGADLTVLDEDLLDLEDAQVVAEEEVEWLEADLQDALAEEQMETHAPAETDNDK